MKYVLLLLSFVFLSGCAATSKHVRKGDELNSRTAENLAQYFEKKASTDPSIQPLAHNQRRTANASKQHAKEDPSPAIVQAGGNALGAYLQGGGIAGLAVSLLSMGASKLKSKRVNELITDLVGESDPEKCKALAKGVRV